MEDQRNWTDASFKTYSTPLRIPYPVEVAPGQDPVQAVTMRYLARARRSVRAAPRGPLHWRSIFLVARACQ